MDFSSMSTRKLFTKYVVPQMIALVCNSVYFIVDGVFIGWLLGPQALAAAGVAVPVVELMIAVSMLISVGTGIMIASAVGRGDEKAAQRVFNVSFWGTVVFSLVIAAVGAIFRTPIAGLLGAGEHIIEGTSTYLGLFMLFSPFLVMSYSLSTYARNDGQPALAMWSLIVGALLNIVLDWVFMVPLQMGLGGAALATGLGPVFSVLILLPHFLRKRGRLHFQKPTFSWAIARTVVVGGAPAFVTEFSLGFVTLLYNRALLRQGLGDDGLAAYMVIGYAGLIALTAFLGAAQGAQPAASYFAASGGWARLKGLFSVTAAFLLGLSVVLYAAIFWGGEAFFGIFIRGDAQLLHLTQRSAQIYFISLPFTALNVLVISFLQSMGEMGKSMVLSLLRSTLPIIALLYILPILLGESGLWLALAAAEFGTAIVAVILWQRRTKIRPSAAS